MAPKIACTENNHQCCIVYLLLRLFHSLSFSPSTLLSLPPSLLPSLLPIPLPPSSLLPPSLLPIPLPPSLPPQPENVMVVKPATELPVVKLLHFSRAREVGGGASSVVQPHLDHMEFEGTIAIYSSVII